MFEDEDLTNNKPSNIKYVKSKYDKIICLNRGESILIDHAEFTFLGTDFSWGEQARVCIKAPDQITILRLELYAKRFQFYEQEFKVTYGDKLNLNNGMQICFLPADKNQVYVVLSSDKKTCVEESFFNRKK